MTFTTELRALALFSTFVALMWIPYVLSRMQVRGILGAMANPSPDAPAGPPWARRAHMAHANAIENLVVFAPLVLIASATGATGPATATAAWVFVAARLVHYVVFVLGIPVIRTLAFLCGFACTLVIAARIFGVSA